MVFVFARTLSLAGICVIIQDVRTQLLRHVVEMPLREHVEESGIGCVAEPISSFSDFGPSVTVQVLQMQSMAICRIQHLVKIFDRAIDTLDIEVFCLRCRNLERESAKWSYLGNDLQ